MDRSIIIVVKMDFFRLTVNETVETLNFDINSLIFVNGFIRFLAVNDLMKVAEHKRSM